MNNFYVLEIQTNADGTSGVIPFGYPDKGDAEDKYLATRQFARQSQVLIHTVMFIDNRGNIIEKKTYVHPVTPGPEQSEQE